MKKFLTILLVLAMLMGMMPIAMATGSGNVAKVGDTEYATIDEAIANWTNGTTLTLLDNVTLSEVIKLSSTEYHILDLGTYTMTAASGKDAIQYVVNGRSSAGYALDIKADAVNPGGITATGGSVVRHTKPMTGAPSKDRPITRFYGGVFNASYVVRQGGSLGAGYTGASAPCFYFYDGEYNGTISTNRSLNQFYGGTFNGSLSMSVDSSAYTLIAGGNFKQLSNSTMSALNSGKFTIGSAKGVYDKEVYIDDDGYYVVAAAKPGGGFEASVAKTPGTNDYLAYSKVATERELNYTDVNVALEKNATGEVTVCTDTLDLSDTNFKGTIVLTVDGTSVTGADTFAGTIKLAEGVTIDVPEGFKGTIELTGAGSNVRVPEEFEGEVLLTENKNELTVTFDEETVLSYEVGTELVGKGINYTDTVNEGVVTRKYKLITPQANVADSNGNVYNYFASLADALKAACDGDTVNIYAGEHILKDTPSRISNKSLTLVGAGEDTTTIKSDKYGLVIQSADDGNAERHVELTVKDLTISSGQSTTWAQPLYVKGNTTVYLVNVTLTNTNSTTAILVDSGNAIGGNVCAVGKSAIVNAENVAVDENDEVLLLAGPCTEAPSDITGLSYAEFNFDDSCTNIVLGKCMPQGDKNLGVNNLFVNDKCINPADYDIMYQGMDGATITGQPVKHTYDTETVVPNPSKDGYTFAGWLVNDSNVAEKNLTLGARDYTDTITLTATWTINTYNITVTADPTEGGTVAGAGTYNHGESVTLTATPDTGYRFVNWTNGDTEVSTETAYTFTAEEDLALVANFENIRYTVAVENGGAEKYGEGSYAYGGTVEIKAGDNRGYTFVGWTSEDDVEFADASSMNTSFAMPAKNVTVTANWTINQYTITFDAKGGSAIEPITQDYGTEIELPEPPTKTGYTFAGWEGYTDGMTMPYNDVTFTATWTINTYGIDVTAIPTEGGAVTGAGTYEHGVTVELTATPDTGYRFVNWTNGDTEVSTEAAYTFIAEEDLALVANFEKLTYTVTWNVDGTETEETYDHGAVPQYKGETPTKAATAQYTYTFTGWDKELAPVNGDVTYTAQFSSTVNKYTVKFLDEDGTELQSGEVAYGETPVYSGETPTKAADAGKTYSFAGWTPAVAPVTGAATYKATYTDSVNKYTVTYLDEDGTTVLETAEWAYGSTPNFTGETPTKAATAQYTYTFDKWEAVSGVGGDGKITGNASYKAVYAATVNKYVVKFLDEDGTELQSSEVAYGETPVYNGETPTKAADAGKTYSFAGWTPAVAPVTGAATYKATYTDSVNKYTVTYYDENGTTVLETAEWAYGSTPNFTGETPTKAATAQYTYTFDKWAAVSGVGGDGKITGNASYKAVYAATVNSYTVTWNVDGTETEKSYNYGETPVYNGETPTKAATAQYTYTFTGWDKELAPVTGNVTYTAVFSAAVNSYTVTFKDYDGTVLKSETLEYGATVTAPDAPTREADGEYVYSFAGWDKPLAAVTGDAVYTATYSTEEIYIITVTAGEGGSISYILKGGEEEIPLLAGTGEGCVYTTEDELTIVVSADALRKVDEVKVNGEAVNLTDGKYVIQGISDDMSVEVSFGRVYIPGGNGKPTEPETPDVGEEVEDPELPGAPGGSEEVEDPELPVDCNHDVSCVLHDFVDVDEDAWYFDAVHYCVENGLMNGAGATTFQPQASTSRAMIVTILWRMAGMPVVERDVSFTDVVPDMWYAEAVRWAAAEGIVDGYSDTAFGPNDGITREQLAAILWRFAKYMDADVSVNGETDISGFHDADEVSDWAVSAMQWACGTGMVEGKPGNLLDPIGGARRCEAAALMMRFCENILK